MMKQSEVILNLSRVTTNLQQVYENKPIRVFFIFYLRRKHDKTTE